MMTRFSSFSLFLLIIMLFIAPTCFNMDVIGGREVSPHSRPFMASIQNEGQHICGGVLIHPQWVLTAAHCHISIQDSKVVLGAHSLSKNEDSKQIFDIKKCIPFPKFASNPKANDIMLIKLHTTATLNKYVQLLHLRSRNNVRAGTKCQVTGWGTTDPEVLMPSDTLQEVTVTIISRKLCNSQSYYNYRPFITKDMVCAGDARGQKDSCKGDSGGPLICKGALYAIVSGGENCGLPQKPGIYTLLTKKYQVWIKSKLSPPHEH